MGTFESVDPVDQKVGIPRARVTDSARVTMGSSARVSPGGLIPTLFFSTVIVPWPQRLFSAAAAPSATARNFAWRASRDA
jgi:hypothetical protein